MKVLIIIPAYNEANSIVRVTDDLIKNYPQYDFLIINDCSIDNTEQVCKENSYNYITLPVNLGIGGGVQAGYKYAYKNNYDIAIQIDGDGQHDSSCLGNLIEPITEGRADMVIGSRFIRKEGFQSSSMRRLGIKFLSNLIYKIFDVKVLDVTSGFRAVNKKMIKLFSSEYAQDYPEPEAVVVGALNGAKIMEVPVVMHKRENGVSSISAIKSMYYMIKVSIAIVLHSIEYKFGRK